ncbi:MAG: ABC transporter substrate-binding protein [Parvibaculales bacterium]
MRFFDNLRQLLSGWIWHSVIMLIALSPSAVAGSQLNEKLGLPKRVVSLDYCADQYVLEFVPRANILALSPDATKSFSYHRARAQGLPQILPHSERVLALKPDLVVRSYAGGSMASSFFQAANIATLDLPYVSRLSDVPAATRQIAAQLGQAEKGAQMAQRMEARLQTPYPPKHQSLLYLTPGGLTAGHATLLDDLFKLAGYENFETRANWQSLNLETLAARQPDILAYAHFGAGYEMNNMWSPARHGLAQAGKETVFVPLEGALTSCGAWFVFEALDILIGAHHAP